RVDITGRGGEIRVLSINSSPRFDAAGNFFGFAGVAIDVTEMRRADLVLDRIARAVGRADDESYFAALARALVEALDGDLAFIGRPVAGRTAIETIAAHGRAGTQVNFSYELDGMPCEGVLGKQPRIYPAEAWRRFPRDRDLAEGRMEAYSGVPMFDSAGRSL